MTEKAQKLVVLERDRYLTIAAVIALGIGSLGWLTYAEVSAAREELTEGLDTLRDLMVVIGANRKMDELTSGPWLSGGVERKVVSTRKEGESDAGFVERHESLFAAMLAAFPPDPK